MARVDFYVLRQGGEENRWRFACRLADKAYKLDNSIHILAPDQTVAERLDELLWTWHDGSFVPHELVPASSGAPVTIGQLFVTRDVAADLLINLCDAVPDTIDAFPRVAEIVTSDEQTRRAGRARYSGYRDRGHTVETHKL